VTPRRKNEKPHIVSNVLLAYRIVPQSEALVALSLPLSPEIVATAIARGDNEGAFCYNQGGGWDNKEREV